MSKGKQHTRRSVIKGGAGAAAAGWAATQFGTPLIKASQDSEITFMNWDPIAGTPLETAINAFQEQSGITVNVQPTPTQDYETKFRTLLASGSPPDIMRINDDFVRGYSEAGQLLDLRQFIEASGLNPEEYNQHPFNFPIQPDGSHTCLRVHKRWVDSTAPEASCTETTNPHGQNTLLGFDGNDVPRRLYLKDFVDDVLVDVQDEGAPRLVSLFPIPAPAPDAPYPNFSRRGGRFGPHNQHQPQYQKSLFQSDSLLFMTWFNAGLRVYDISDARQPEPVDRSAPSTGED